MISTEFFKFSNQIQHQGGDVLVRWDGLRNRAGCTISISCGDFVWRKDGDDIEQLMHEAMLAWKKAT